MKPKLNTDDELRAINHTITGLLRQGQGLPGLPDQPLKRWEDRCLNIRKQLSEDILRIAVVGAIKSGKSAFINSLMEKDYLKRGAGVVTSIVTRIRFGGHMRARLFFKSWEDINSQIQRSLVLFPELNQTETQQRFDIRNDADRSRLQEALSLCDTQTMLTDGIPDTNYMLLSCFLKGYGSVKDLILDVAKTVEHSQDRFHEHHDFVSNDALAAYLADILLEIDCSHFDMDMEIADCQGSDSPNPLHLAMIQDYLLTAHLVIYVISSRTGVRQADMKFLAMLKTMGMLEHLIFVINADFSEHDNLNDLQALLDKVTEEIGLIKNDPEIFCFSTLFNLFSKSEQNLHARDVQRLAQWKAEEALAAFSNHETTRFTSFLLEKLSRQRLSLLWANHLARLHMINKGITRWIELNYNILTKDEHNAADIVKKLRSYQETIDRVKTMIKSTLDGVVAQTKREIKIDVDRFFDNQSGDMPTSIIRFIDHFQIPYERYSPKSVNTNFSNMVYRVFQDFQQDIDTYMIEVINPELVRFFRREEQKITESLKSAARPFEDMIQKTLAAADDTTTDFGSVPMETDYPSILFPHIDAVKAKMGLSLPPAGTSLQYTVSIKSEAMMRFGLYSALRWLNKLIKKPADDDSQYRRQAVRHAVARMKKETRQSILSNFNNYKENIKYQYFLKLIDAMAADVFETVVDRFQICTADLSKVDQAIFQKDKENMRTVRVLDEMGQTAAELKKQINRTRQKLSTLKSES
jgi:GTPase SAR1 family protein